MELDILFSKKTKWCTIGMAIGITAILLYLLDGSAGASPPPAILEIDGKEQSAGIGSNCWKNALNRYKRPFEPQPKFNLSLLPGLYVFNVFAKWQ